MDLVKELYSRFPEFDSVSDHMDDELKYVVFGGFSLFLFDLLVIKEEKTIREGKKMYTTESPITWETFDIDNLIERAFTFVDELMSKDDAQINDVVYSCIFWTLQDNPYTDYYAKKYFSRRNFRKYEVL